MIKVNDIEVRSMIFTGVPQAWKQKRKEGITCSKLNAIKDKIAKTVRKATNDWKKESPSSPIKLKIGPEK
jgi:hypothetical protein